MCYKIQMNIEQVLKLEGHTEITIVFQRFVKKHPEAANHELRFNPAPWNELHAQQFKHVPNEWIEYLEEVWLKQLNQFLMESEPNRISA